MRVSTFELLSSRIAPPIAGALARRVLQGYFLTISNLENRTIRLSLRLTIPTNSGNRVISATNTRIVVNTGTLVNSPLGFVNSTPAVPGGITVVTTNQFTLAPQHTGSVAVLPAVPVITSSGPSIPTDLEIRGAVELVQSKRGIFGPAVPAAQVLLTPEHRGTYIDEEFSPPPTPIPDSSDNVLDFDQLAYSLPLASGKAENTLAALPSFSLDPPIQFNLDVSKIRKANPELSEEELEAAIETLKSLGAK